jgi:hypothetical protein
MATYSDAHRLTLEAADDLSTHQYKFVALGASTKTGKAVLAATAGMVTLGVLYNKPKAGEEALIISGGKVKVKTGASVSAGAAITTDNAGLAVTATAGGVSGADVTGSNIVGQYLGAGTAASGDIIEVLIGGRIGVLP